MSIDEILELMDDMLDKAVNSTIPAEAFSTPHLPMSPSTCPTRRRFRRLLRPSSVTTSYSSSTSAAKKSSAVISC